MPLELDLHWEEAVMVVRCRGRIQAGTGCERLLETVRPEIHITPDAVLNLSQVQAMDSAGIGALVRLYVEAHVAGGRMRLSNVPPQIRGLLKVAMLTSVIQIHPTEEAAVAASARRPGTHRARGKNKTQA